MKSRLSFYPFLRKSYRNCTELGDAINRSESYVKTRLAGHREFTLKDKLSILKDLCIEPSEKNLSEVFAK